MPGRAADHLSHIRHEPATHRFVFPRYRETGRRRGVAPEAEAISWRPVAAGATARSGPSARSRIRCAGGTTTRCGSTRSCPSRPPSAARRRSACRSHPSGTRANASGRQSGELRARSHSAFGSVPPSRVAPQRPALGRCRRLLVAPVRDRQRDVLRRRRRGSTRNACDSRDRECGDHHERSHDVRVPGSRS